jgi:CRP-like cAMP-binding protein
MTENSLLAVLPASLQSHLGRLGQSILLTKGTRLFGIGDAIERVYFPTGALVSLLGASADGGTVELISVARDGVVGLPAILNAWPAPHDAVVRVSGSALRLGAHVIRDELRRHELLREAIAHYASRSVEELAQAIVCQCFHNVTQRLSRWLLVAAQRTGRDALALTHEDLAQILGVGRPVVTRAALELQDNGGIRYRYGRLTIVNPRALERSSCDCYQPR